MLEYSTIPSTILNHKDRKIHSFVDAAGGNMDGRTVESFGAEWTKFKSFSREDIETAGSEYFDLVDETIINKNSVVLDVGCGSGRYSKYISGKVGFVEAIDPSDAVFAAGSLLSRTPNARVTHADIDNIPFRNGAFDFVFCLGVLHHVPDTQVALNKCVAKLKSGGSFLLYLYYNHDNRGAVYKSLFTASNLLRGVISWLPGPVKSLVCDIICVLAYVPLAAVSRLLSVVPCCSRIAERMPLSYYRNKSFWIMRNDTLDRFGTPLEKRYTRREIREMMEIAGLKDIIFSPKPPFWHAVGKK